MPRTYGPKGDGVLWIHEKTGEKQPDYRGHIALTREQLHKLLEIAKSSGEDEEIFKVQVALWDRMSKEHKPYKYLATEVLIPQDNENGQQQQPQQYQPSRAPKKPWD